MSDQDAAEREPDRPQPTGPEPAQAGATASDVQPQAEAPTQTEPPAQTGAAASGALEVQSGRSITRGRLILVDGLIVLTTILAVVGMLSVFANRLLFNPDNWEHTSTQLLQNSDIRSATANYLVDQLYNNVNVAAVIQANLPPRLQPLAGPAAGAFRNVAVQGTELALSRPLVQSLWGAANRAAAKTFIAVADGGKGAATVSGGAVTLNLGQILSDAAARLGLPSSLTSKIPPNAGMLTVFKSNQLKYVQNGGKLVRHLALWLTILVPLLYALAIFLAGGHRRRTLMSVGFAIVIAGLIGVAGRHILETGITNSLVTDAAARPAVRATVGIGTYLLGEIAEAFIFVGVIVVAAAFFAGPVRWAVASRRAIAPFLRSEPAGTFGITAGVLFLIFLWDPIPATGTLVGIIVFTALAFFGVEMLRRQTAVEFPDVRERQVT